MLRLHFLQQWFNLSDPDMEEALYDAPMFREFAGLDAGEDNLPDEGTILRFRHPLEANDLSLQILATVNATLTENGLLLKKHSGRRHPDRSAQLHHGMKAHIGADADSDQVHTVTTTAAHAHDITQADELLHGEKIDVFADSSYWGVEKRETVQDKYPEVNWL